MFEKEKLNNANQNTQQPFNFRTDLASERRDLYRKANSIENEIQGIESKRRNKRKHISRKSKNYK